MCLVWGIGGGGRRGARAARADFAAGGEGMDADTVFSTDALVWPLVIAAVVYFGIIRPFYGRGKHRRGRDD